MAMSAQAILSEKVFGRSYITTRFCRPQYCHVEYRKSDISLEIVLVRPCMKVDALCLGFFFGKLCALY
jgi:hypothetical protein